MNMLSARVAPPFLLAVLTVAAAAVVPSAALAQADGGRVPSFAVDPTWPKTLPETWTWRQPEARQSDVLGINADAQDHVWVTTRGEIAEYDPQGNLLQVWSPRSANPGFTTIHGLFLDHNGFLWTTAREQHQVLKFTRDGRLVLSIGKFNETAGSNDAERMGRPAEVYVDPQTNELFVADGYTNRRVVVYDAATGRYLRHWGAYGNRPDDNARNRPSDTDPSPAPAFAVPHGITGSRDGFIYLADRTNSRVQVFERSGKFVRERVIRPGTGGAFSVALSPDPQQEFVYVPDGTQHRIWILRRRDMEVVGQFSREGRQPGELGRPHNITVDTRGNIYVSEADPGRRAQKFTPRGVAGR
ncbi:MAG: hypothetical protein HY701_10095 [Gemmatimonadetes bacterium]|nr:hypothetical protein [Gemmatimonadota bacterium]